MRNCQCESRIVAIEDYRRRKVVPGLRQRPQEISLKDAVIGQRGAVPEGAQVTPNVDKTLTKGLLLLDVLSRSERPRGVSELALDLSLTKSNVHRLLQTLVATGFVARDHRTEKYYLTSKLLRLSRRYSPQRSLIPIVRPMMKELVARTEETAAFFLVEGNEAVMIDQVETPQTVRVFFEVGEAYLLDQILMSGKGLSALQQVVYAYRPDLQTEQALQQIARKARRTASFVKDEILKIRAVRDHGFAISRGEWMEGANAVAVPVTDMSKELLGVLVSFGPSLRLPEKKMNEMRREMCLMAEGLTRKLEG